VEGALPDCHDGAIMLQFLIIAGSFLGVVVVFSVYRVYGWKPRTAASTVKTGSGAGAWRAITNGISWLGDICVPSKSVGSGTGTDVPGRISTTVFGIAVMKFLLGVAIALHNSNWWTYSGGREVSRNDAVLASCSNPTAGDCYAFCGDVIVIPVDIPGDDLVISDVGFHDVAKSVLHFQNSSYCVATLPGYCGYEFWLDFKLLPLLLQFLGLALQVVLWKFGSGDFAGTPQRAQYNSILDELYPQLSLSGADRQENPSNRTLAAIWAARADLVRRLSTPVFPCIFWFLELVTVVYVWGEVVFPPIYCGSVVPLSLYYYPIMMSLLDLGKFNIYTSVQLFKAKRRVESALALLDLQLFLTHLWLTVAMGLVFLGALVRDCRLGWVFCWDVALGRRAQASWAEKAQAGADVVPNPMLLAAGTLELTAADKMVRSGPGPCVQSNECSSDV